MRVLPILNHTGMIASLNTVSESEYFCRWERGGKDESGVMEIQQGIRN